MSPHEELFHRLLDESSALLAAPERAGIAIPDDDLHREIIVPLLPAMLGDKAIRGHWSEQAATGFVARIGRHFENGDPSPRWTPGDFEIHVTASYSAGADARALADTLLSEDSLRDMTAALMNQLRDALWPSIASAPETAAEVNADEVAGVGADVLVAPPHAAPAAVEVAEPKHLAKPELPGPTGFAEEVLPSADEAKAVWEPQRVRRQPSRALIRTVCRKLTASAVQRGFSANSAPYDASAAILSRRISQRAMPCRRKKRTDSRMAFLG